MLAVMLMSPVIPLVGLLVPLGRLAALAWLGWHPPRSRRRSVVRAADAVSCLALAALTLHAANTSSFLPMPVPVFAWWRLFVPLGLVVLTGLTARFTEAVPGWDGDRIRMVISGMIALIVLSCTVTAGRV